MLAADDMQGAVDLLRTFDPDDVPGIGFPPGAQLEAKQRHFMSGLRQMYHERVSALLQDFDVAEHVE